MMLRYGLNQPEAADKIEQAVAQVLENGDRTGDIFSFGTRLVGCRQMGDILLQILES
jgi:3-isopropylmalate dehydrogenase